MTMEEKDGKRKERKISTDKYIMAGVITLLVFSLGLTLGLVLEEERYDLIEEINQEQEVKSLSLQLQYLYLTSSRNYNNCPVLSTTLKAAVEDLSSSLSKVITYEEESKVPTTRKELVQRRYLLDNVRYWLLARESKQQCHLKIVPILYFHNNNCDSCPTQGTILSYFKKVFGEQVLVFPINLDLSPKEPMIEILAKQFNVTVYPTIIIDETKYEKVVEQEKLKKIICKTLVDDPQCQEP